MLWLSLLMKHEMDQLWISFPQQRLRRGAEEAWELSPSHDIDISLNNDSPAMSDHRVEFFRKKKKSISKGTS